MMWTIRPRSDFGDLAAIRAGDGPMVVLLHGVGLRAEAWNAQIDALASRYSVIAPDMAGHGESPVDPGLKRLADYSARIADALTAPCLVIGHSMGAMIALDLAVRYPHFVRGVVAMNAIYRRTPAAAEAVGARAASLDGTGIADPTSTLRRWFGDEQSPEADACRAWLSSVDPRGYRAAYRVFAREDGPADDALNALACRSLFMTGAAEPNSTPAMAQAMAARAPGGRAVVVPGAAHMMPMTHPTQVNAGLTEFLAECGT